MAEVTGYIKFIHNDGKKYHFVTDRNTLNNMQMFTYNNWKDCFASDLREVKTIIKNIFKKAIILETDMEI